MKRRGGVGIDCEVGVRSIRHVPVSHSEWNWATTCSTASVAVPVAINSTCGPRFTIWSYTRQPNISVTQPASPFLGSTNLIQLATTDLAQVRRESGRNQTAIDRKPVDARGRALIMGLPRDFLSFLA